MDYIPVDNVCMTELFYIWDVQRIETVLHFRPTTGLTPTKMGELGLFIKNWYDATMDLLHPTTLSLVGIKMTDMTLDIAPVVNYATGLPLSGLNAGASLPNNCALVLTKRTILRGRSYRGRIYHPGLKETEVTGNTVLAAQVTGYVNAYSQLLSFTTATATWKMVVVSRFANKNPRPTGEVTEVTSIDSDGTVDSQRRRLPGRGS